MLKVKNNSKQLNQNDIFLCTHDILEDRHKYISDAIKKKPSCIIVDKNIFIKTHIPIIRVNNTNDSYYQILNNYYDYPLDNINLIGITGTDGKTSTAMIAQQLLNNFYNTAYLGTNGFYLNNRVYKTTNTTPNLDTLFYNFSQLNKANCHILIMEVSSEGLLHNRCHNINFDYAVLTNITKDHLNIHKTFNNYLNSKLKLFNQVKKDGISILNIDDKQYKLFKKNCKNKIITYGTKRKANYYFYNIKTFYDKTTFTLRYKHHNYQITSPLLGTFNVYNLVAAISLVHNYGIDISEIINKITKLQQIPGRLEKIDCKQNYSIILDYAHTSFATEQVLQFFNRTKKRNIITVVGCAGERYTDKRKEIGKIVTTYSDQVIFTMDDPRNENVLDIINEMISEVIFSNYEIIEDRKKAIEKALSLAKKDDIVLILGKGKDNYMAVKDEYLDYSDYKVIKNYYEKLS